MYFCQTWQMERKRRDPVNTLSEFFFFFSRNMFWDKRSLHSQIPLTHYEPYLDLDKSLNRPQIFSTPWIHFVNYLSGIQVSVVTIELLSITTIERICDPTFPFLTLMQICKSIRPTMKKENGKGNRVNETRTIRSPPEEFPPPVFILYVQEKGNDSCHTFVTDESSNQKILLDRESFYWTEEKLHVQKVKKEEGGGVVRVTRKVSLSLEHNGKSGPSSRVFGTQSQTRTVLKQFT